MSEHLSEKKIQYSKYNCKCYFRALCTRPTAAMPTKTVNKLSSIEKDIRKRRERTGGD